MLKDIWTKTKTVLVQVGMFLILIGGIITGFWWLFGWLQKKTDITTLPTEDEKKIGVDNPSKEQDMKDASSLQNAIEGILKYKP